MKTIIVTHRSKHHAESSGYSRLIDYLEYPKIINGQFAIPYFLAKAVAHLSSQAYGVYSANSVFKELELHRYLKKNVDETKTIHFLNAERDLRYSVLPQFKIRNALYLGTFHKPPAVLEWRIEKPKYIRHLDAAIVVGKNQVNYVRERFQFRTVKYIPHGVDVEFFSPSKSQRPRNRILMVGQHLRDFDTFNRCIPILKNAVPNIQVEVVVHRRYKHRILNENYVEIKSGLTDIQLRECYRKATVMLLPMTDSTACNSILEAMACGLPIVTTNVGGNYDYLRKTECALVDLHDFDGLIKATTEFLVNKEKWNACSVACRAKSLLFNWVEIKNEIQQFYSNLHKERSSRHYD